MSTADLSTDDHSMEFDPPYNISEQEQPIQQETDGFTQTVRSKSYTCVCYGSEVYKKYKPARREL